MAVADILASPEGRQMAASLASQLGLSEAEASAAMARLLPELVAGLERNTLSRGGIADLLAALASGNHARALDEPARLGEAANVADGTAILGHILGSPGRADRIAQRAMEDTGLSGAVLKQILPMLAVFLLGWLFRNGKGALGDVLGRLPAPGTGGMARPRPSIPAPGNPGGTLGGSPLPPLPDLGRFDRSGGGTTDNPYGDLADVLRKGGGGGLSGSIRDILGGLLGFRSKGILGWIIRYVVLNFGWSILKMVLRRMVAGR